MTKLARLRSLRFHAYRAFRSARDTRYGTHMLRMHLQHCASTGASSALCRMLTRLRGNRGAPLLHGIFCGCWSTQTPRFARLRRLPWYVKPANRYFPVHASSVAPHRTCIRFWQGHVITKGEQAAQMLMDDIEVLVRHNDRHVREAAVDAVVQVCLRYQHAFYVCLLTWRDLLIRCRRRATRGRWNAWRHALLMRIAWYAKSLLKRRNSFWTNL
jgi:hypothetical protein